MQLVKYSKTNNYTIDLAIVSCSYTLIYTCIHASMLFCSSFTQSETNIAFISYADDSRTQHMLIENNNNRVF